MCSYSKFRPESKGYPEGFAPLKGWEIPNLYLVYITCKMHKLLKQKVPQYAQIDGDYNIWISKPSYNSRGLGVFCFDQIKDAMPNAVSKRAMCPKIVQKYIERPSLYEGKKFDIR
jgi:hypothetical protein